MCSVFVAFCVWVYFCICAFVHFRFFNLGGYCVANGAIMFISGQQPVQSAKSSQLLICRKKKWSLKYIICCTSAFISSSHWLLGVQSFTRTFVVQTVQTGCAHQQMMGKYKSVKYKSIKYCLTKQVVGKYSAQQFIGAGAVEAEMRPAVTGFKWRSTPAGYFH